VERYREYQRLLEENGSVDEDELYEQLMQGLTDEQHYMCLFEEFSLWRQDFWSFCEQKLFKHAKVFRGA
jgi:hypothetical protein